MGLERQGWKGLGGVLWTRVKSVHFISEAVGGDDEITCLFWGNHYSFFLKKGLVLVAWLEGVYRHHVWAEMVAVPPCAREARSCGHHWGGQWRLRGRRTIWFPDLFNFPEVGGQSPSHSWTRDSLILLSHTSCLLPLRHPPAWVPEGLEYSFFTGLTPLFFFLLQWHYFYSQYLYPI